MNHMKLAFKKLREYLGRDTHGIQLLQEAEKIANDFRKENPILKQEAEAAKQAASQSRASFQSCEQQLQEERALRQVSEAKLRQLEVTTERLKSQIQPKQQADASEPLNSEIAIRRVTKSLRHDGFKWPPRYRIHDVQRKHKLKMPLECYDVVDIINNWSGKELLKLGRFVALEAIATTEITVLYSSQRVLCKSDATIEKLIGLLEWGNCLTMADDNEAAAEFVGSTAEPPKLRAIERNG